MVDPRLIKKPGPPAIAPPPGKPAPPGASPIASTPLKPVPAPPSPIRLKQSAPTPKAEPPESLRGAPTPTPEKGAKAAAPVPAGPAPPPPAATAAPVATATAPVPQFTRPPPATATPPTDAGKAPEAPAEPPKPPPKPKVALQKLVEVSAILVFLLIAVVPFARFGIVPMSGQLVTLILVVGSLMLTGALLLFGPANYQVKKRGFDDQLMRKYRRDMILTSLSVGATFVTIIMFALEVGALLVYLKQIDETSELVVTVAGAFDLFAAFTLLFLTMLVIVRTSFETRAVLKKWHAPVAYMLLVLGGVIGALTLLVNYGVLNAGAFAEVEEHQSIYLFTLAVFFQIIASKLLLRYPSISQIVLKEMESARRANQDLRDQLQKRAYRAYFIGLGFVVLSMFLLGGVATRRLNTGSSKNVTFILILYLVLGLVVLGIMVTRYLQHKYIAARNRRQASGEVIAKKRRSKQELNRIILFGASATFAFLAVVVAVVAFTGLLPGVERQYGTDFMLLAFLVGLGPYGFYRGQQIKRIRAMDDKFPDFLRDLAESERAGMTLPRALQTAAKGLYGGLTGEVRHMSAQVSWGVSFTDAIQRFAKRVNTPLISRTVALIVEASRAGGNVIDILTAASDDAREIKQIVEERKRQMGIYGMIVYIAFFVFLVVVFVLSKQFLPAFSEAAKAGEGSQLGGGGGGGGGIKSFNVESFTTVFFHSALIQGVGGGLVSGVMQEGHPIGGLKHAVIMCVVSWVVFRIFVDDLLSKVI